MYDECMCRSDSNSIPDSRAHVCVIQSRSTTNMDVYSVCNVRRRERERENERGDRQVYTVFVYSSCDCTIP